MTVPTTTAVTTTEDPGERSVLPPLRPGDRLTREEFERRYEAMPHVKKAELIEGVVHMPSPVHIGFHARPHLRIATWIGHYCAATPGTDAADNATVRLGPGDEVQPDVMLFLPRGGKSRISSDDYIEGAPELVVEVASSSADYDAGVKRRVYQRGRVQEYVLWRTAEQRVDWWALQAGAYVPLPASAQGIIASRVFPGLWLDVVALLEDRMAQVLATVQRGLASAEHAAFAETLKP
ncbi:MAG: Uma2 family endonuclease [Chloroflexaceae bacterium]|nr:Uma2 family endonuclease [Chloroflexaceae bacterium]